VLQHHLQQWSTSLLQQLRHRKSPLNIIPFTLLILRREYITIETITADRDNHKAGSVVYHIPQHAAERIHDFLVMTGIAETQNACKGQNVKRADTLDQCLQQIQRHAMNLAEGGPSNLLQLAPQNLPRPPGPGQPIDFPVDHIAFAGIYVFIPVYRGLRPVPNDQGWDPVTLSKSALGVTIAMHVAMAAGQSLLDVWIDKEDLVTDLTPDRLACPKDLICTADDCGGQEDGKALSPDISPICKQVRRASSTHHLSARLICAQPKTYGCNCEGVLVPHMMLVNKDYMDEQYKWLEELIKRADMPDFQATCDAGFEDLGGALDKARLYTQTPHPHPYPTNLSPDTSPKSAKTTKT
jgi:hypothetical protein